MIKRFGMCVTRWSCLLLLFVNISFLSSCGTPSEGAGEYGQSSVGDLLSLSGVDTVLFLADTISDTLGKVTLVNRMVFVTGDDSTTTSKDTVVLDTGAVNRYQDLGIQALNMGVSEVLLKVDTLSDTLGKVQLVNQLFYVVYGDTVTPLIDTVFVEKGEANELELRVNELERTLDSLRSAVFVVNNYGREVLLEVWSGRDLSFSGGVVTGRDINKIFPMLTLGEADEDGPYTLDQLPSGKVLMIFGIRYSGRIAYLTHRVFSDIMLGWQITLDPAGVLHVIER